MKTNTYIVDLRMFASDTKCTDEELFNVAIDEARERVRTYYMPSTWTAEHIPNKARGMVKVKRYHN